MRLDGRTAFSPAEYARVRAHVRARTRMRSAGSRPTRLGCRLVAALDETIKLPLDADTEGTSAEFVDGCLRITLRRTPEVSASTVD